MAVNNVEGTSYIERRWKAQVIAIFKYFTGYHVTKGFDCCFFFFFSSVAPKGKACMIPEVTGKEFEFN